MSDQVPANVLEENSSQIITTTKPTPSTLQAGCPSTNQQRQGTKGKIWPT